MKIEKLSQYTEFVESLPPSFNLSRGQSNNYPLLPSGLRRDKDSGLRKYSKMTINKFLEDFKLKSYQYIHNPWDLNNDLEWVVYAQHYGVPTRLLDFTTSHITSLLFAVEKSFISNSTPVVYFLDPAALNLHFIKRSEIINVSSPDIKPEDQEGPFVIQGRMINKRINAQKGLFAIFQDDSKPLEELVDETILKKIEICPDASKKILSTLYSMGISFTHIYPELDSVAKDIVLQKDVNEYVREIAESE